MRPMAASRGGCKCQLGSCTGWQASAGLSSRTSLLPTLLVPHPARRLPFRE